MPRSSGRSSGGRPSAPSRPSAPAPAPRAPQQQQTRPMSTAPPATQAPPQQASAGPGLFGQMASTAAGVAVGSSIGHAIGGFFGGGGGGSSAAPAQEYQQPVDSYAQPGQAMNSGLYNASSSSQQAQGPCATDIRSFTQCMEQNGGDMNICQYYLEQLKACQQAARNY